MLRRAFVYNRNMQDKNISVLVIGAGGRMGRMLVAAGSSMPGLAVSAATEIESSPFIGRDAGEVAGIGNIGVTITAPDDAQAADIAIDFTFHSAVPGNFSNAIGKGAKGYVLGTTGLTDEEKAAVSETAKRIPIVWAPNFSLGVNLLLAMAEKAASLLDDSYDVEIVEMHHRHKKDAPSGTAIGLAEAVAKGRGIAPDAIHGRSGLVGERPQGEIAIHALRGGDVVGDHTVVFAADGERIELVHKASSRSAFANGAMKAALWLHGREPGIYTMRDVLGL